MPKFSSPICIFILLVEIAWDGSGWIKGNAGQTGFYRINYEQKQWDQLTNQLENDHEVGTLHVFTFPLFLQNISILYTF